MVVPFVDAVASIRLSTIALLQYRALRIISSTKNYFQPQTSDSYFVTTNTLLTVLIDARASPRNPKV